MGALLKFAAKYGPKAVSAVKNNWSSVYKWITNGMSFRRVMEKLGF